MIFKVNSDFRLLLAAEAMTSSSPGNSASSLLSKSSPSKEVNTNIPLLSCSICKHTETEAKQMRSHYMRVHSCDVTEDDIIGLTKSGCTYLTS